MSSPSQITPLSVPQATPPLPPPPVPNEALRYTTNAALVAAPVLLLIPPRKLDLYTLSLCALWAASAEHQVRVRSGHGILQWAAQRSGTEQARPLGPKSGSFASSAKVSSGLDATQIQQTSTSIAAAPATHPDIRSHNLTLREHVDPWAKLGARLGHDGHARLGILPQTISEPNASDNGNRARLKNVMHASAIPSTIGNPDGVRGIAGQIWMGNEPSDWKERRMREEQSDEDEGLSVGDRILKQIWMVWNQAHTESDPENKAKIDL